MAGNPNAEIAKRFFDAVAAADLATIQSLLADDAVLTLPGSFSRAGVFKGRDEFLRGVGQLVEASGGTLRVELLRTFVNGADGDQVIGCYHGTGTVKGEPLDEHNACLMTCANGVIVSLVDFYGDPETVERMWD
jgi:ketosteroid isomerase-like protein